MAPLPPELPSFLLDVTEGILTNFETISGSSSDSDIEMSNCDIDNKFYNIFHDYQDDKLWLVYNKISVSGGSGESDNALSQFTSFISYEKIVKFVVYSVFNM